MSQLHTLEKTNAGLQTAGPDHLYSIPEAAEILGIGRSTFYKRMNSGDIKALKDGRRTLISGKAIEDYAASLLDYLDK